jgi:hypothetical protein
MLFFSSITLFSIERGNLIILSAGCIAGFIVLYTSPIKYLRIIALLLLCVAAVLKVYPVLLGLLLVKDRNYKALLFCIIVSLLLIFVPFTFFKHGFGNIVQLTNNVFLNSTNYSPERMYPRFGLPHLFYIASRAPQLPNDTMQILITASKYFVALLSVVSMALLFYVKEMWVEIALIIFVIIQLPINSGFYCGLYLFPVIVLFLTKDNYKFSDWIYIILFCIFLNPYQLFDSDYLNYCLSNIAVSAMWLITIYIAIRNSDKSINIQTRTSS